MVFCSLHKPIFLIKVPNLFSLHDFLILPLTTLDTTRNNYIIYKGQKRVKIVSIASLFKFGCTTIVLATNPLIKCPMKITLMSMIFPLSSLWYDIIPKEFLYLSKIYHNESLIISNKTWISYYFVFVVGCNHDKGYWKTLHRFNMK